MNEKKNYSIKNTDSFKSIRQKIMLSWIIRKYKSYLWNIIIIFYLLNINYNILISLSKI